MDLVATIISKLLAIGNREEREERGLIGSYLTTTRLYNPKTILKSIKGKELSLSLVLYKLDKTS